MENVNLKRKVTLKRKGDSIEKPPEGNKPNTIIWLVLIGLVGAGLFFGINQFSSNESTNVSPGENVVQSEEGSQSETQGNNESETSVNNTDNIDGSEKSAVTNGENPSSSSVPAEVVAFDESNTSNSSNDSKPTSSQNSPTNSNAQSNSDSFQGSVEEKAKKVIRGDFGNGEDRKNALGSDYETIQAKVNEMYIK